MITVKDYILNSRFTAPCFVQGDSLKVLSTLPNNCIFVKSLSKRLTLGYLWEHNIIAAPGGPRPFTPITDEQFDMIVKDSETEITYVE